MSKTVLVVDQSKKPDGEQSTSDHPGKGHLSRKSSRSRLRGGSLTGKVKKEEKESRSKHRDNKGQDSLSTRGNDDADDDSDEISRDTDAPPPSNNANDVNNAAPNPNPLLAAAMLSSGGAHASGTSNEPAPVVISKAVDFTVPDSEENILFIDGTALVKAATFSKLIERLTCQTDFIDPDDFLYSYRLFATAEEVLNAIFIRFHSIDKEQDKAMKIRIFNFFKKWVEKFWLDLSREEGNATLLLSFVDTLIKDPNTTGSDLALAKMVRTKMEQKQKEGVTAAPIVESFSPSAANHADKGLFDYTAQDIANHLTRIEWDMWIKVKENELFNCGWTKKNKLEISPNVVAMTRRFNQVSDWVASLILTEENIKKRVKMIAKFVEVAACLKTIGNYNGVLEIYSAFQRGPVARLKQSFSQLDPDVKQSFAEIEHLTNNTKNYANLRLAIADIDPPVLPYLGMYLTDILFAIEGNGPHINGLINFYRCRVYSETIKRIKQYQLLGFESKEKVFIDANLLDCLQHLPAIDESDLYTISAFIEPREGKEPGPRPDQLIDGFLKNQKEKRDSKGDKKKGKTEKKELKEIEKLLMKDSLTDSGGKSRSSNSRPHSGGNKEGGPKSALLAKTAKRTSSFSLGSHPKSESLSEIFSRSGDANRDQSSCEINLPALKPRSQSNTPPIQPQEAGSTTSMLGKGSTSVVSGTTSSDSTATGLASPHSASSQGGASQSVGGLPQLMPNWNANAISNATSFISLHPASGSKSEGRRKTSISGVSGIDSSRDDKSGGGPESDEASLSHMDFGLQYPVVHQSLEKTRVTLDACVEGQKKLTAEHSELLVKVQQQEKELAQQRDLIQNQAKELETLKTLFHVLMNMNKPASNAGDST